ncbi:HAMP domain-containing protein [Micromonospora deserti]|uniref:HAMP domain-containing protein n=1 Tax=Micromonospora deserti TaxID=2070366 RepID=UPI0034DD4B2F
MGRALRPLRAVTETARAIEETDLSRRIPVSGSDEVATWPARSTRWSAGWTGRSPPSGRSCPTRGTSCVPRSRSCAVIWS